MATTIDHLGAGRAVRVIRSFTDARGVRHDAGERGFIIDLRVDWPRQEILLAWRRDGREETMAFPLAGGDGPGNGRMRTYFELEEEVRAAAPRPRGSLLHLPPPGRPPLSVEDAQGPVERIVALADNRRFDEANEELRRSAMEADDLARALGAAAERRALERDPAIYEWLRDRAIDCWYAWGAQATSGGDGAARLLSIRPAIARFRQVDDERRLRAATPGDGCCADEAENDRCEN